MTEFCVNGGLWSNAPVPWTHPLYLPELKKLGVEWVRFDMQYGDQTGQTYLYAKMLKDNGFKVLGIFAKGLSVWDANIGNRKPLVDLAEWTTLVQKALTTYADVLDAIEVWNEPDLTNFYSGYMNGTPEPYFQMLKVVWNEVHARGLNIPIIAGAIGVMYTYDVTPISPIPPTGWNYGATFLQKIKLFGSDAYCDAYSIHIYQWYLGKQGLNKASDAYIKAKNIIGEKPVWVTEIADPAGAPWLTSNFNDLINVGCPFLSWYSFWLQNSGYSLLNTDLTETPIYWALRQFIVLDPAIQYVLDVWTVFGGTTTPTGIQSIPAGTEVSITATAALGYKFGGWQVQIETEPLTTYPDTENPLTLTITAATTVMPLFTLVPVTPTCPSGYHWDATANACVKDITRTVAARSIGPLGVPSALLHQLWRLRERIISKEVHKKLHPLV